jgi:hypothetical protein
MRQFQKYSPFQTAGWTQVKPFAAERPIVIITTFWVCTADSCYTVQIITAGKKMFTDIHYTTKMEFAVFSFIDITKIG